MEIKWLQIHWLSLVIWRNQTAKLHLCFPTHFQSNVSLYNLRKDTQKYNLIVFSSVIVQPWHKARKCSCQPSNMLSCKFLPLALRWPLALTSLITSLITCFVFGGYIKSECKVIYIYAFKGKRDMTKSSSSYKLSPLLTCGADSASVCQTMWVSCRV